MTLRFIPDGFHTITPNMIVEDAKKVIDFIAEPSLRKKSYG